MEDFEKLLFQATYIKQLHREKGEMQSEIDELRYKLENIPENTKSLIMGLQNANSELKRKVMAQKAELSRLNDLIAVNRYCNTL